MFRRSIAPAAAVLLTLAACSKGADQSASAGDSTATAVAANAAELHCSPAPQVPVPGRASPYDSVAVPLGADTALLCYGRPSMKGRTIFGGLIPFGQLWRTGANEPTILHLPVAASIAGMPVEAGSYSIYTMPGEKEWTIIVNRSTSQWGIESQYTPEIAAQEVGRATVPAAPTSAPVEQFTIHAMPGVSATTDLVLEWENTSVAIPIARS
jgi:hypothetical protein